MTLESDFRSSVSHGVLIWGYPAPLRRRFIGRITLTPRWGII
ncbi:MAG: hypothetical protein ABSC87_06315 [Halobacteriota archaeon]